MTAPDAGELREAVGRLFGASEILRCDPHPLRSSCPVWELELERGEAGRLAVMLKDLGPAGLSADARRAKPSFLHDATREIDTYRLALAGHGLGTAEFHGAHVVPARQRYWLFLELVDGVPLWQSGHGLEWAAAAAWLAKLHQLGAGAHPGLGASYGARFYAWWMPRALRFAPEAGLEPIESVHRWAVERLAAAPRTLVHGEFYPSNVLVRAGPDREICPVDFELAGTGPGVLDLAALSTGLPDEVAASLVSAYLAALASPPPRAELEVLLLCARLHLAVRWLGWSGEWRPPRHQAHDWAREARVVAERLGRAT
jgi:Ser/Thr protein kinase RdoA (MazF antagonist)